MNHKDTFIFIGKCLSLRQNPSRIPEVRKSLRSGTVVWEQLVWLSSKYLVLPALYINLRDSNLLSDLPAELVEHLDQLHKVNTRRNEGLMEQVWEINNLLVSNGISPIFIKGTAHVLDHLYRDLGERMIGDIDFLVEENHLLRTVELLKEAGYQSKAPFFPDTFKKFHHYPRLINEVLLGAIEVHRQPIPRPYDLEFNFNLINKNKRKARTGTESFVSSDGHQIIQSMMNISMKSSALHFGEIDFRHLYDLYLLSNRIDPLLVVEEFGHHKRHFNKQLILASILFSNPDSIKYYSGKQTERFKRGIHFLLDHPKYYSVLRSLQLLGEQFKQYISMPIKVIYSKTARRTMAKRLGNPSWYRKHFRSYKRIFRP